MNIYKIRTRPTRAGYMMMLVLLAMLIASANYSNNMAYILTFLLFSLMLVGMVYSRYNLKGLAIANVMPRPVFAGERVWIDFELQNQSKSRRYGIWLAYPGLSDPGELSGPFSTEVASNTTVELSFLTKNRGRFILSFIELMTVYPLGLFMVKGKIGVERDYLVYPHPEGNRRWPEPEIMEQEQYGGIIHHMKGGEDFTGVRPYRPGESMHHIDWKAAARGRPLSIKEFIGGGSACLYFGWEHLAGMGAESRLSQLCQWVLEADEQGMEFGLKLPGITIKPGSGSTHTLRCLETLALFNLQRV
ncbi:MAG: DUF58 domain-containing protein [Acidobacteria bacterium]|jgi:uncharacterized protein (DUF58 family)|nr:DUF58 domain-containing protein [Acidobacteriota bacterium]